jgi:hypothetical protein
MDAAIASSANDWANTVYSTLGSLVFLATQTGPHSPNGALAFEGPDGTWGAVIWSATA